MKSRDFHIVALAAALAFPTFALGRLLLWLIQAIVHLLFWSASSNFDSGASSSTWPYCLAYPALGGLIVGLIARYFDPGIRGHGVPEVMESVLEQDSRIGAKRGILKSLASAISIGSGGPFGAEGPVIGLGGAVGSLFGQVFPVDPRGRRILLSAGAAAGITAVFACPMAAVFLSIELLLFEFSPVALISIGIASLISQLLRLHFVGSEPLFLMPPIPAPNEGSNFFYILLGLPIGLAAHMIAGGVHYLEGVYEKSPFHWMWWPVLGGLGVGILGYWDPRIFGPGYESMRQTLEGTLAGQALALFLVLRLLAWSWALASSTAGGTLAPLFELGAAIGALLTVLGAQIWPQLGLDPRIGALVGMGALFAGASRALLASILLALETTQCYGGALALMGACVLSTGTADFLGPESLMTASLFRKGISVPRHLFPRAQEPTKGRRKERRTRGSAEI